jgi:hypothetical protein
MDPEVWSHRIKCLGANNKLNRLRGDDRTLETGIFAPIMI